MNLFWKKLFGGITPTARLEKNEADLVLAMQRYAEVEKSVELEEYNKLFHIVKSAEFQEKKKTLQNRRYKDTEEFEITQKYKKLQHSPAIQLYYQMCESEELVEYLNFKATPEYEFLGDKKKVKASESLKRMKAYEKSKGYKTYVRFHNSFIIKEYEDLKIKASTPEFMESNAFWENKKRWHSTPEFQQQERFYELAKNPDVEFYVNERPERFDKYRKLKLTFQDEFEWNTLDKSHWNFGFHYKSANLIEDHSFANEKQANNSGRNVEVLSGILKLETKHEKVTARAWHAQKGFIQKEFHYTSDVLQTAEKFRQKYGVIRAKIRCSGKINHAFWLGADDKLPNVKIFHFDGKKINVGNANNNIFDGVKISGLNPGLFHVYSLIWTEKELIWMINNLEVYRTASNIPAQEMYLAFNSFIPEKNHAGTGQIEVDWVRVYTN
ncbi:MAG: family 16 glycosylhydrolase [Paludibacter sp.]